jgi:hypothetical protein
MKCLLAALLVAPGVECTRIIHNGHGDHLKAHYPEEVESCAKKMNEFFTEEHPAVKGEAIRLLVDKCFHDESTAARRTVCPHLERVLTDSLWKVPPNEHLTPDTFCKYTEAHLTDLQGVAKVPRVGSGKIHTSDTKKTCEPTVEAALDGAPRILSTNVPDFWYALCLNQDCAHMLPSRTKWCNIARSPTHSSAVCSAARTFVKREVESEPPKQMPPSEVCDLYSSFHKEMATDVAAYRHVVHGDPFPSQYIPPEGSNAGGKQLLFATFGPLLVAMAVGLQ